MRRKAIFLLALALTAAEGLAQSAPFRRGDANQDGLFDISDPVKTLGVLFVGESPPGCDDAMDANDDELLDITDGIYPLAALFTGGPAPPAPYPECGQDPTPDAVGCQSYAHCAPECLDGADLEVLIAGALAGGACVPADAAEVPIPQLSLLVKVCPEDRSVPCGGAQAAGCPVNLEDVQGNLDAAARMVRVAVTGRLDDFPVVAEDTSGLNPPIVCTFDITFQGALTVPFTTRPAAGGGLEVADLLEPQVAVSDVTVTPSPGFLCALIAAQKDQLASQLQAGLTQEASALLAELEPELVGQVICP